MFQHLYSEKVGMSWPEYRWTVDSNGCKYPQLDIWVEIALAIELALNVAFLKSRIQPSRCPMVLLKSPPMIIMQLLY